MVSDVGVAAMGVGTLIIFVVAAFLVSLLFVLLGMLLSHKRVKRTKVLTFECGQKPFEWRTLQFPIQYFPYLIIYVVYAVVAILVLVSLFYVFEVPDALTRVTVFLAILAFSSIFLSVNLKRLVQRI
ncbi:MAG: NADH-quinone oxidoreductase subunit A [Nitrososphaerota archaeon]|nr:NADH-quinone oxidoreductase subunit A [Aigarchaeota archaeon]MDW8076089.1 NADH-quinone oxidoreductase subunit A [Nitrososphaerota archaeon]